MFGLGLRYGVSNESIAAANGLAPDVGLLVSQQLIIPWPTATPPLEPVALQISGQTIIADPTDCSLYEINSGDTLLGVASRNRVDYRALLAVNRLTEGSILQPGDEICIPRIIRSGVLPPTPGPSPTPTNTPPPAGPNLLLPFPDTQFGLAEKAVVLQWVAVKDLDENEWYMVEMTDLTDVDSHPLRAFVRHTSFLAPEEWRPNVDEIHQIRWQVAIVKVMGQREDGQFIYTFGGSSSEEGSFYWQGAVPTATPPIPTETPTPSPSSGNNG
jgi:LysM repeat protein